MWTVKIHYGMECWVKRGEFVPPVRQGGSSSSANFNDPAGVLVENPPYPIRQQQSRRYSPEGSGGAEHIVLNHSQLFLCLQNPNRETHMHHDRHHTPTLDMVFTTRSRQHTRFHRRQESNTMAFETILHTKCQNPILLVGDTVLCRRP